jgi:hypothetical protein
MRRIALVVFVVMGCEAEKVGLNERVFELPSLELAGRGCTTVELGGSGASGTGGASCAPGAQGACLGRSMRLRPGGVDIVVTDRDGTELVRKSYDAAFLRSGRRDEFAVTGAEGRAQLFRYWGTADSDGNPLCAPFEDSGETVPPR